MPDAFGLYLILTDPVAGYGACARAAVLQGVRYLQLRIKKRPEAEVLKTALALRKITAGTGTVFIVNDHLRVAMESDADGVHLGQEDMDIAEARSIWKTPGKIFGLSTHNEDQEKAARLLAPDYIGVGPVFSTPTKENPDPVVGLERMGEIIRSSPLTAVAIGGIDEKNLPDVISHGARNFAVVRAVNKSPNPEAAIALLMGIWRRHQAS
ncbi:MAG: thiamine phosphate synthase [Deltaproteobacteria bacterium]|nr:thiamine phosphate synthase [Deltaproteobacteria bacterium]